MSLGFLFWIIMLIWLLFGVYENRPQNGQFIPLGRHIVLWVLLAILGWEVFGPALHR